MKRRKNPFPGVNTVEDRHGKLRHRLRRTIRGHSIDIYLPGPYGSPEFRAAYEQAIEGARGGRLRAKPGTMRYLVEAYREAPVYRNLSATTRRDKAWRLNWISEAIGEGRYAAMQPRHVEALMAKKAGPAAANRLRKDLAQLFRFAAKRFGYTGQNPATLADPHKESLRGFHTWTDDEIEIFRAKFPTGTKSRLALEIFLNTGAARQDAAALTRRNIRGGRLFYRRGKTGQEVDLPILPELARELAQLPADQVMLLAHGRQPKSYSAHHLGTWFRERCKEAGLADCSAHGLRKAGARRLAEAGATEWEVMAFLAHRTAQEASRYTAAANRAKLTSSGMAKLGADHEQVLSNLSERLDKRGT
ncbi:MAG: tyrosine-type recombinase/integrase [Rhodospirillales bacterium]|nr:tyrosine-type recombinase/integrase [Rhodospirillales bacterium]MDE0380757.1 tyrosine-type recombinase/integrase [Rhodospirillales bacterium]